MEVGNYNPRINDADAIYRNDQDEKRQRFIEAYRVWVGFKPDIPWWFMEREKAWDRYLLARRAWTGY